MQMCSTIHECGVGTLTYCWYIIADGNFCILTTFISKYLYNVFIQMVLFKWMPNLITLFAKRIVPSMLAAVNSVLKLPENVHNY